MKELKLKSNEIGWIKYCLIRTASSNSFITKKRRKNFVESVKKNRKTRKK